MTTSTDKTQLTGPSSQHTDASAPSVRASVAAHTPAPWLVGVPEPEWYGTSDSEDEFLCVFGSHFRSRDDVLCLIPYSNRHPRGSTEQHRDTARANQARIVECVNGYDALRSRIEALEAALRRLVDRDFIYFKGYVTGNEISAEDVAVARAALAKVQP